MENNYYGLIYKVTNLLNNKLYIGQTVRSLECRKYSHEYKAKSNPEQPLHYAIRKYGIDNFKWETLCYCENQYYLDEKEKYYINLCECIKEGYNCRNGGGNNSNSIEVRYKISNSLKGRKRDREIVEKISKANLGKKRTEEQRKRISDAHKGIKIPPKALEAFKVARGNKEIETLRRNKIKLFQKNRSKKLKINDVLEIRKMYKTGKYTQKKLANIFNVCQHTIWAIIHNKVWIFD